MIHTRTVLLVFMSFFCVANAVANQVEVHVDNTRTLSGLLNAVKNGDTIAYYATKSIGSPAVQPLSEFTYSPDSKVRDAAYTSLAAIDDPAVIPVLLRGIDDPNQDLSIDVTKSLLSRPDAAVYKEYLRKYTEKSSPIQRWFMALYLPKVNDIEEQTRIDDLKGLLKNEKEKYPREMLILGLASLGEKAATLHVIESLKTLRSDALGNLLWFFSWGRYGDTLEVQKDKLPNLRRKEMLPGLIYLLDNQEAVTRIGVDGRPGTEYMRACDIAMILIAKILNIKDVSFKIETRINFKSDQILEFKNVLHGMGY